MDERKIADTPDRLYYRQAWDRALQMAAGLAKLVKHNWRGLSVTASLTAAAILVGCNVYFGQDQGTETPPAETQGGGVTVVSPIATATITAEAATSTPPPPEIKPTPLGIEVANAGGSDSEIIITNPNILLPTNIDPAFLADHRVAFRTMQERIGYGFCIVINDNQQGPCYDVVGSIPGDILHNGQNFVHDSAASNPGSGLYVYIAANGERLLNVGIFKHQDGFTLIQAIDKNGNVQTHLVGPDGKVQKLFDLVPLGAGGSIVSTDLENGAVTLSTGEIVSLVSGEIQTPILLAHPQTWAECLHICPKITSLEDLQRIRLPDPDLIPINLDPDDYNYSFYWSENSRGMDLYSPAYLGAFRFEWNGVPAVAAALAAINRKDGETKPTIFYVAFFTDGSPAATYEDAARFIRDLSTSRDFRWMAITAYLDPAVSTDPGFLAAIDLQREQGIYDLDINSQTKISSLELKIIPVIQ